MSQVKLQDVIRRANTKVDKDNTDLLYYVGGEHIDSEKIRITRKGLIEGSTIGPMFYYGFKEGDFLLVSRNPHLKKAGVVNFSGICSEKTFVLETSDAAVLLPEYLPFVLQNQRFWDYAYEHRHGSTNTFINWSTLANYEFELPDIESQRNLAAVLWAINDTIDSYNKLILATDNLVKSQFIEMFGSVNQTLYLKDCCSLHARVGWQALKKSEFMDSGDYMLITGTDFKEGHIDYSSCVYVSKERYDMDPLIQVQNGDILITKDGTIGKVAIVEDLPMPATLNAGVFVVRPDGRFNKGFFSYLFKGPIFADFVELSKTGSTIKHLNQAKLLKYEIPEAPMQDQEKFDVLYKQSDKSKFELEQTLNKLTSTYKRIIGEYLG